MIGKSRKKSFECLQGFKQKSLLLFRCIFSARFFRSPRIRKNSLHVWFGKNEVCMKQIVIFPLEERENSFPVNLGNTSPIYLFTCLCLKQSLCPENRYLVCLSHLDSRSSRLYLSHRIFLVKIQVFKENPGLMYKKIWGRQSSVCNCLITKSI